MEKFLPVLSGSLRDILTQFRKDYPEDEIAKEILRVDKLMQFYLDIRIMSHIRDMRSR